MNLTEPTVKMDTDSKKSVECLETAGCSIAICSSLKKCLKHVQMSLIVIWYCSDMSFLLLSSSWHLGFVVLALSYRIIKCWYLPRCKIIAVLQTFLPGFRETCH